MKYTVRPIADRTVFTGRHQPSQFSADWTSTRKLLIREVSALNGRDLVLEVDVTEDDIRIDGELRANARPSSPAVRIAFGSKFGPLIYATDKFSRWQDNARAIALSLEALRKVDRYGVTKRGEQYTGWKAIGSGPSEPISLGGSMSVEQAYDLLYTVAEVGPENNVNWSERDLIRRARRNAHPDRNNGDHDLWHQVEIAAKVLEAKP